MKPGIRYFAAGLFATGIVVFAVGTFLTLGLGEAMILTGVVLSVIGFWTFVVVAMS